MQNHRQFEQLDATEKFSSTTSNISNTPRGAKNDLTYRNPSVTSDNYNPLLHNKLKTDLGSKLAISERKSRNFMDASNLSAEKSDRAVSPRFEFHGSKSKEKQNILHQPLIFSTNHGNQFAPREDQFSSNIS